MFIAGLSVTVVLTALFFFIPRTAIPAAFALEMLRQLAYGFTIPLLWAMMADVADYSEWKNRRRATAIVFSAIVFGLKAGLGFGGAIGGWVLSAYGYVPNVEQTRAGTAGHQADGQPLPGRHVPDLGGVPVVLRIDRHQEVQITTELAERRKAWAAAPVAARLTMLASSMRALRRRERDRGTRCVRDRADARQRGARTGDRDAQGHVPS